ncbi:MAG: dephospho-CoA kinase [Candidatus Hydrogenedentales bacterium]
MKRIIGLTGGYCAGKSQAADILETMGFANVDADRLAHRALGLCAEKLVAAFGRGILAADGSVDRKALGALVFSDPERLRLHESIVHPVILGLMEEEIAANDWVCVNAPLLYRTDYARRCDLIIEVRAPLCQRIRRGRKRDGLGTLDILRRIASQRPMWKLRPTSLPGGRPLVVFVDNSGSREALERGIKAALAALPSSGNGAKT